MFKINFLSFPVEWCILNKKRSFGWSFFNNFEYFKKVFLLEGVKKKPFKIVTNVWGKFIEKGHSFKTWNWNFSIFALSVEGCRPIFICLWKVDFLYTCSDCLNLIWLLLHCFHFKFLFFSLQWFIAIASTWKIVASLSKKVYLGWYCS